MDGGGSEVTLSEAAKLADRAAWCRAEFLRKARWWDTEVARGYPSAANSARYAKNMRWAAELVLFHGPGAWLELIERAGVPNPETRP